MKLNSWDIGITATLLLIIIGTALTFYSDYPWIGQDLSGIPGLFFLIAVVIFGARLAGRLERPQGGNLYGLHKKNGIFFTILIAVAFVHSFWDRIYHGEPFFWQHTTPVIVVAHGWIGLIILVLAVLQIFPSLIIRDRRKIRRLHMIFGYVLLTLVVIQILLGIGDVLAELAGD